MIPNIGVMIAAYIVLRCIQVFALTTVSAMLDIAGTIALALEIVNARVDVGIRGLNLRTIDAH